MSYLKNKPDGANRHFPLALYILKVCGCVCTHMCAMEITTLFNKSHRLVELILVGFTSQAPCPWQQVLGLCSPQRPPMSSFSPKGFSPFHESLGLTWPI